MSRARRQDCDAIGPPSGGRGPGSRRPGGLTLRSHLVLLVLAVLLPSLLVGAAAAWRLAENSRAAYRDRLADTVRALSLALDSEIGALSTFASTVALSPAVARRDLAELGPWVKAAAEAFGTSLVINEAAPGFPQVLNTALPEGTALPPPAADPQPGRGAGEVISRALATGRPAVSDLFRGRASGRLSLAVAAPLPDRSAAVVVDLPVARLSRLLAGQVPAGDAVVAIADRNNVIVARSRDAERFVGREAPGRNVATASATQGLFEGRTSDGTPALYAYRRLTAAPGWSVVVAEPLALYRAGWMDPLLGLAAGATAALLLSLVLAAVLARRIRRPVEALVARVEGRLAAVTPSPTASAGGTVAEFRILQAAIERADATLREREAEFRAAFEQAAVAMSQVEVPTGRLVRVNPAYCALLGRPEAEILGHPFSDFVHPDDREGDLAGFQRLAAGQEPVHDMEKRYVRPDGSVRLAHIRSSVVRNAAGRPDRTVAIVEDVTERRGAEAALAASEERLRLAQEAGRVGSWEWDVGTGALHWSETCHRLHGTDPSRPPTFEGWLAGIHPEDRAAVQASIAAALEGPGSTWETENRYNRHDDGAERWIVGRGRITRDPATGRPLRMLGIALDATERIAAEKRLLLMAREVDHRAKNILAVVQAAVRLTPRTDAEDYARAIEGRVRALAGAHTLLADSAWSGASLLTLVRTELQPFIGSGVEGRITIRGTDLLLSPSAAQPLSMVLHELTTNAAKYGSLSHRAGRLTVTWSVGEEPGRFQLDWTERNGPELEGSPARRGFGSRIMEAMVRDGVRGSFEQRWDREGLSCRIVAPSAHVLAD